jgi:UDP-2,3-diacylglucosamine hydrolase
MGPLFISDLHLDESRPEMVSLFLEFLTGRAPGSAALYILGDLFDAWVGDDDDSTLAETVCEALRILSESGTPVFVAHGNRDFLLGSGFEARSGARLLDQATVIDLAGTPTLLLHGDELCTDDLPYQALRQQLRAPAWQADFLARPLAERRHLAANLRAASLNATQSKSMEIMDVNLSTVTDWMRRFETRRLIHGHTHRPAVHRFDLDGRPAERVVLSDWHVDGQVVSFDPRGKSLAEVLTADGSRPRDTGNDSTATT